MGYSLSAEWSSGVDYDSHPAHCDYDSPVGVGFWPSRDPIQEEGGLNIYSFVYNNPLIYWDILGGIPNTSGGNRAGSSGSNKRNRTDSALDRVLKTTFLRCYLLDLTEEDLDEINAVIEQEMSALDTDIVGRYLDNLPTEAAYKFLALNAASRELLATIPQGKPGIFGIPSLQSLTAKQLNKRRALLSVRRTVRDASIRMVGRGGIKVWGRIGSKLLPIVGWFSVGYEAAKACNCIKAAEDDKYYNSERLF